MPPAAANEKEGDEQGVQEDCVPLHPLLKSYLSCKVCELPVATSCCMAAVKVSARFFHVTL